MIRIGIRPVWRFRSADGERDFDFQLLAVLEEIEASGKLTRAAQAAGLSYRHAWNLVAGWERFLGAPLVAKARGRGTRLEPLGKRLLLAGRRAQARLAPELDHLAAGFSRALEEPRDAGTCLVVRASHDFALAALREMGQAEGIALDVRYDGSFDALAALRRGECDVAGFHLPEGPLGPLLARRYAECIDPATHRLVGFVTRMQGLIVRAGNPKRIESVTDLARPDVRMVNRQRGSGTRALLEFLLASHGVERARVQGYGDEEITHAAVAALVAGSQADVGFGVQAAAANYGLGFVPVCRERYLLAFDAHAAARVEPLLGLLRRDAFARFVASLPGYAAGDAGVIVPSFEAALATA